MTGMQRSMRLYVAALVEPTTYSLPDAIAATVDVYARHRIDVQDCGVVRLERQPIDIRVGSCDVGSAISPDQERLFAQRGEAKPNDICVYIVRSTIKAFNGCSRHPTGVPGTVIVHDATRWTMAHEVGHLLGLQHCSDGNHLMIRGTINLFTDRPILDAAELARAYSSPLISTTEP